jgi:hypothetical protein
MRTRRAAISIASAGGADTYGLVVDSAFLTPGSHTVILKDIGGNELARGTLTVTR